MKALYRHPIITSLIITPILLAIAAVSGGAGHAAEEDGQRYDFV